MRSSTLLDSAIFQLTPTRTRCDLIITANGKTEKIASGLLNPFLAHLKTAQDQIARGGYSILLEPEPDSDTTWFTKGTVERFVRFVSTPEILERVYTIESEILQIEEAIAIQGNNDVGLNTVDCCQPKPMTNDEACKPVPDANEEKAIVLYKPDAQQHEANGIDGHEENSKVQLLKVLESRKTALQKEQGMAFARAVAAGFYVDHMTPLVSFAECFGASRLLSACSRFIDLWKRKHETEQWLEIEAAEAMSSRSDFSAMNASGIMLSSVARQNESHGDLASDNYAKESIGASAEERRSMDHTIPASQQEYFQGQFPHPMYPSWPMHSPPGTLPVYQAYPVQGVPYYQSYPGNGAFFQPPYPMDDCRPNVGHTLRHKRHSKDCGDSNVESDAQEIDGSKSRSQDDLELAKEDSQSQELRKKTSKSVKKQSGVVVIRNINYISKRQNSSGSESESSSDSEMGQEAGDSRGGASIVRDKNTTSSKRKGNHAKAELYSYDKQETSYGNDIDGGHWQAFQNYLLRDVDEDKRIPDQGMFAAQKDVQMKRKPNLASDDPLTLVGRNPTEIGEGRLTEAHTINGNVTRKLRTSKDEIVLARDGYDHDGRGSVGDHMDAQFVEMRGGRGVCRRTTDDGFLIGRREGQQFMSSSDPLAVNGFERAANNFNSSPDESFIVPFRSMSLDQVGNDDRTAIDMGSELPSVVQKLDNNSNKTSNRTNYEPNDLNLMPERRAENGIAGYDPALEYEMQVHTEDAPSVNNRNKDGTAVVQGTKKLDRDRKSKAISGASDKKKTVGPIRKGKPSKMSPLDDARVRAEKLRNFKADQQKMKKEKEEEQLKRLEALKIERQKRIAARGSSTAAQSSLPSPQTRKQLPTKLSPSSLPGSKFSDSEPGASSPLQRSKIRNASLISSESQRASKVSKTSNGSQLAGNRLTKSVSSLPDPKKEGNGVAADSKASMVRLRRLSEPRTLSGPHLVPDKVRIAETVSKPKVSDRPESKKISAIINLDKSKAATLPELKIRTSKGSLDGRSKSATKEMTQKLNGAKTSVASEVTVPNGSSNRKTHNGDVDENPIIEKTVVMLEYEKPPIPVPRASSEHMATQVEQYDNHNKVERTDTTQECTAICETDVPVHGVGKLTLGQVQEQHISSEVLTGYSEDKHQNFSGNSIAEKPYQAPYARLSSLEDACTGNLEYAKAPSMTLDSPDVETAKIHVSGSISMKLEKIPEVLKLPQVKDSPKGFRRLLNFGRKNRSSAAGERSVESDSASVNGSEADESALNTASSSEVHTLKNLISQDETPTAGSTSQKSASRHLSLLLPFRSKTGEKQTA